MPWPFYLTSLGLADLLPTLAQARRSITPQQQSEILFWSVVLVAIATVVGIVGYLIYRKLRKASETHDTDPAGFSLSEMRRLYEAGEVSHEEFVQVKEKILAAARRTMALDGPIVRGQTGPSQPPAPPAADDATGNIGGDRQSTNEMPPSNPANTSGAEDDVDHLDPPRFEGDDEENREDRPST